MELGRLTDSNKEEMELDDSTTHVIIQFSVGVSLERVIRLVPRLWVAKTDGKWVCLYPQKKYNAFIVEWVKKCVPPRADFDRYEVKVLKEASMLFILLYSHNFYLIKQILC